MNVCQTLYDVASIIEINLKYKKREIQSNIQIEVICHGVPWYIYINDKFLIHY